MNENEFLAATVSEHLERNSPVVLVSLLSLKGSTPRHEGSKMAVGDGGKPYGTIGGSLLEAAAIQKARKVLETRRPEVFSFELTGENAAADGMICGGTADVLLDYLEPSAENRTFAAEWHNAVVGGLDCFLLTGFAMPAEQVEIYGHAVMFKDGKIAGDLPLKETDVSSLQADLRTITRTSTVNFEDLQVLVDPMRRLKTLYMFGAGHVALPTAHMAAMVGFRVVVIDDRSEFASIERFPEARQVLVIEDFGRAMEGLPVDEDSCIVIVTRGHQYDRVVLEQALKTSAGYIGMISSRRKREAIYTALKEKGVAQEALDAVHSPIGIDIGGETPEEIAVSIVAELISVRTGKQP